MIKDSPNLLAVICYGDHFKLVLFIIFFRDVFDLTSNSVLQGPLLTFAFGYENNAFMDQHALWLVRFTVIDRICWGKDCIGHRHSFIEFGDWLQLDIGEKCKVLLQSI